MANAINWFEIPVKNFSKAKTFYETILEASMHPMVAMGMKSAFFPADMENGSVGGCIIEGKGYEPTNKGSLVYLNGGEDLGIMLSKVEQAGGKIILPKTAIGPNGFMAHFEEMKTLPSRVAERLAESGDPMRRKRMRRMHPMMLEELMHLGSDPGDPVAVLMLASLVRDDMPWLYELAMEVYRAAKSGDSGTIELEINRLRSFSKIIMHGPLMEEFGFGSKDMHMFAMEFPRILERTLRRSLEFKESHFSERESGTLRKPPRDDSK